jgi:hypothetical protein
VTVEEDLAQLRAKFGARWEFWIVPLAIEKGYIWCARLHDNHRKVLNARQPDHLAEYVADADAEQGP